MRIAVSCLPPAQMQVRQESLAAAVHRQLAQVWTQADLSGAQYLVVVLHPPVEWIAVAHLHSAPVLPARLVAMHREPE